MRRGETSHRADYHAAASLMLGLVAWSAQATAQGESVTIRGSVYSSDPAHPLAAALVTIDERATSTRSDINGQFALGPIAPGSYLLTFERAGYALRAFRVTIADTLTGIVDIETIQLQPTGGPFARLQGTLTDVRTASAIPLAAIALNGEIVAATDEDGSFEIDSVALGNNLFEARRIGYTPLAADLNVAETQRVLNLSLTLEPLPFRLDDVEVVVEGDRTIYALGRMREFYRRRRSTPGNFFTREDIERRNPLEVSDMLRTVPGVRISQAGFDRNITIRGCSPVVYLDGMPLRGVQLDNVVFPDHVEAIEVHRGAFMPVEFMAFGACAAVAIWTR